MTSEKISRTSFIESKVYNNQLKYHGFSELLAEKYNSGNSVRTSYKWIHGAIFDEIQSIGFLEGLRRTSGIVVPSKGVADYLRDLGFISVIVGGLPFSYVSDVSERLLGVQDSMLAIPSHSFTDKTRYTSYLDFLQAFKGNYEKIYVLVGRHYIDGHDTLTFFEEINRRGLWPLKGAIAEDRHSLKRVRLILSSFPSITTNCLGSHIAYALLVGSKLSISGPYISPREVSNNMDLLYERQIKTFKYIFGQARAEQEYENFEHSYTEAKMRTYFPHLLTEKTLCGRQDIALGRRLCGVEHTLNAEQFREVFDLNPLDIVRTVSKKLIGRQKNEDFLGR